MNESDRKLIMKLFKKVEDLEQKMNKTEEPKEVPPAIPATNFKPIVQSPFDYFIRFADNQKNDQAIKDIINLCINYKITSVMLTK